MGGCPLASGCRSLGRNCLAVEGGPDSKTRGKTPYLKGSATPPPPQNRACKLPRTRLKQTTCITVTVAHQQGSAFSWHAAAGNSTGVPVPGCCTSPRHPCPLVQCDDVEGPHH